MKNNKTKPYWVRDDINVQLKGEKGEFINFRPPGLTISKKQDNLCNEVLAMLNRRYSRLKNKNE